MADAGAIRRVVSIVKGRVAERPIVVVSAFARVTDALLEAGWCSVEGRLHSAMAKVDGIRRRTIDIAAALLDSTVRGQVFRALEQDLELLETLLGGAAAVHEFSPRTSDAVAAFGELISSRVIAAALVSAGVNATFVDSRDCIVTDEQHTRAVPLYEETERQLRLRVAEATTHGVVPVLGGFIAATTRGVTTTLGRGGSDFSAALIGQCVQATRVEIWTDVNGIMTCDPRICPDAKTVDEISFDEAAQLAAFGAKVIHPATLVPAVQNDIPVWVLNTFHADGPGTCIQRQVPGRRQTVKAIAAKKNVSVFTISAGRVLDRQGFLQRVFDVLDHSSSIELVCSSENSVSVAVTTSEPDEKISRRLQAVGSVEYEGRQAIVCLVGEHLFHAPGVLSVVFNALREVKVRMVAQGASRTNFAVVVNEAEATKALRSLHAALFSERSSDGGSAPAIASGSARNVPGELGASIAVNARGAQPQ